MTRVSNTSNTVGSHFSHFSKLTELNGGFASIFSGTSTMQSDFSFIGLEKVNYQFNLTDLSVGGVLQAKQSVKVVQVEEYLDILMETKG
jgi:hypothetical protein